MKKALTTVLILIAAMTWCCAQDYGTALGLRGGFSQGITLKHFIKEKVAVEGIFSLRWRGYSVTGLYEIHDRAFQIHRLNWYYGVGGHIGFWNGGNVKWFKDTRDYTVIGIDGILGLEYNFEDIPINVSADWKPALNIFGYKGFWGDGGAVSIRYIF